MLRSGIGPAARAFDLTSIDQDQLEDSTICRWCFSHVRGGDEITLLTFDETQSRNAYEELSGHSIDSLLHGQSQIFDFVRQAEVRNRFADERRGCSKPGLVCSSQLSNYKRCGTLLPTPVGSHASRRRSSSFQARTTVSGGHLLDAA